MPEATAPVAIPPALRMRRIRYAICLAAALSMLAASCSGDESTVDPGVHGDGPDGRAEVGTYSGYVVDPPNEVAGIVMPVAGESGTDTSEVPGIEAFDFSAVPGGLNLIYFGYTFCPDVCPTTMSDVRRVLAALPEDEVARIGVAMVTIDPARDTAQVLSDYVANFVDEGVALRTDDDTQLRAAADAFGADYEVLTNDEGDIEVSHTGELYAVDDSGTVVMQWPFGTSHESVTRDIRSLLAQADPPT